jgi:hypothetical protein
LCGGVHLQEIGRASSLSSKGNICEDSNRLYMNMMTKTKNTTSGYIMIIVGDSIFLEMG